jgi:DNA-binding FrmR family transcriptional regulator
MRVAGRSLRRCSDVLRRHKDGQEKVRARVRWRIGSSKNGPLSVCRGGGTSRICIIHIGGICITIMKAELNPMAALSASPDWLSGIERMIEEDGCCVDILNQISAVRSALDALGIELLTGHVECWVMGDGTAVGHAKAKRMKIGGTPRRTQHRALDGRRWKLDVATGKKGILAKMLTSGVDMGDRGTEYFKFKQYPRSAHSGLAAALTASRRHYFTSRGFAFINIFRRFPDPLAFYWRWDLRESLDHSLTTSSLNSACAADAIEPA